MMLRLRALRIAHSIHRKPIMANPTTNRQAALLASDIEAESGSSYPPVFHARMAGSTWRAMGDRFGLTQFGINLETLPAGTESALRHWHTLSDEFIYVTAGELVLRTDDGETLLTPGMCAGFAAGVKNGHHLINRSNADASFIVVGSRVPGDNCFYPDDDLLWVSTEDGRHAAHKDGRRYEK